MDGTLTVFELRRGHALHRLVSHVGCYGRSAPRSRWRFSCIAETSVGWVTSSGFILVNVLLWLWASPVRYAAKI